LQRLTRPWNDWRGAACEIGGDSTSICGTFGTVIGGTAGGGGGGGLNCEPPTMLFGDCAQAPPAASNVTAIAQIKSECRLMEDIS
jgi:hypothetical protein